ncbi:MAG: YybH family protein [Pseudonocardia sp.]
MDDRTEDFAAAVAEVGRAVSEFVDGDPAQYRERWARRDDVTIFGGWGGYERGWEEVGPRLEWAAARFAAGATTQEVLASGSSGDLGYTVTLERGHTRLAGAETAAPMLLRVTHVYRRVDGVWKVVHRHADPITGKTATAAVLATEGSS